MTKSEKSMICGFFFSLLFYFLSLIAFKNVEKLWNLCSAYFATKERKKRYPEFVVVVVVGGGGVVVVLLESPAELMRRRMLFAICVVRFSRCSLKGPSS